MQSRSLLLLISACLALSPSLLLAQEEEKKWGNLSATFLYDDEPPEPRRLKVDKDTDLYKDPIFDPSLIVDRETKGIANVVLWLYVAPDVEPPAIHKSYEKVAKQEVSIDTVKGQIEPHVALVWLPQTLLLKNSEPIGHNLKSEFFANVQWSDLIAAGGTSKKTFTKRESRPMPIACNIHSWESGWLLIRDNPYMAVSDAHGQLQFKNLPVSTHSFVLWHERSGYLKDINRDGKPEMLPRGRVTIEIKPGDNDLGKILIKPLKP